MALIKVLYTHQKTKKWKTWQDGFLRPEKDTKVALLDENKTVISSLSCPGSKLVPGEEIETARYLITIDEVESAEPPPAKKPCVVKPRGPPLSRPKRAFTAPSQAEYPTPPPPASAAETREPWSDAAPGNRRSVPRQLLTMAGGSRPGESAAGDRSDASAVPKLLSTSGHHPVDPRDQTTAPNMHMNSSPLRSTSSSSSSSSVPLKDNADGAKVYPGSYQTGGLTKPSREECQPYPLGGIHHNRESAPRRALQDCAEPLRGLPAETARPVGRVLQADFVEDAAMPPPPATMLDEASELVDYTHSEDDPYGPAQSRLQPEKEQEHTATVSSIKSELITRSADEIIALIRRKRQ